MKKHSIETLYTNLAPTPAGHYSQAVISNGFVFLSGQLPLIPGEGCTMPEGIQAQTRQVFANIEAILQKADTDLNALVNVQIFIPDLRLWEDVNQIYQHSLGEHKPARTVIPCGLLHYGALIEVNAVAVL